MRIPLDSAADREAFAALADDVENGSAPPGFDVAAVRRLAERAADRTGREMGVSAAERTALVLGDGNASDGPSVGLVSVTFTWENFATANGNDLVVGDAFESWTLGADQRLELRAPPRYGLESTSPAPDRFDDSVLVWNGPEEFDTGQPAVRFTPTLPRTGTTTNTTVGGDGLPVDGPSLGVLAVVGGAVVVVGGVVAYALTRREELFGDDEDRDASPSASAPTHGADGGSNAPPAGSDGGGPVQQTVDPELLSDEERVEQLLAENGGRMKQADIVTETGWSNAKVSQLLSSMDEAGRVEKLRIGRENLISLPDAGEG